MQPDKNDKNAERKNNPQPGPRKTRKGKVMVSGIKMDQFGKITTYKIGYDKHGVAKAVSFDSENNPHKEESFAKFIGDGFRAKTEEKPGYMENLGSKNLIMKLKIYCSDPHVRWYAGNLSRRELVGEYQATKVLQELAWKKRMEYIRKHRPGYWLRLGRAVMEVLDAVRGR